MSITFHVDTEIQSVLNICRLHDGQFIYLLKCNCNTKINTHGAFTVIHRHAQRSEKFESPNAHVTSLSFLLQVSSCKQYPFYGLFSTMFSPHLCVFSWYFFCLKWPQSMVPKYCLGSLSAGRLCPALQRRCRCSVNGFRYEL